MFNAIKKIRLKKWTRKEQQFTFQNKNKMPIYTFPHTALLVKTVVQCKQLLYATIFLVDFST